MKTGVRGLVWMVALSVWVTPRVWGHSGKATGSVRTYTPITIDGKLDDWVRRIERSNWPAKLETQKGNVMEWLRAVPTYLNALTARVESGTISSPEDFSAVVYTLWDEKHFYLAAVVTDDQIVTEHEKGDIWQDDGLEVWLPRRADAAPPTPFSGC